MKAILLITVLFVTTTTFAQKKKEVELNLKNAVVIGQMDKPADRYSIEINLTELFASHDVKSVASLNLMKLGADSKMLASDSLASQLKAKGFDTYVLVTVRGYDRRFKVSSVQDDFSTALSRGNLFEIHSMDVVSVSFEFKFFRNGEFVYGEIVKCGNVSDRESVLKRFRKKVSKRILKEWK
ncbi:MAG: hypothetical protein JKY09_01640 [Crocinitomicaceae bacterium]|nr:hypothetical protein [Crocinitomicaceae bacterium]